MRSRTKWSARRTTKIPILIESPHQGTRLCPRALSRASRSCVPYTHHSLPYISLPYALTLSRIRTHSLPLSPARMHVRPALSPITLYLSLIKRQGTRVKRDKGQTRQGSNETRVKRDKGQTRQGYETRRQGKGRTRNEEGERGDRTRNEEGERGGSNEEGRTRNEEGRTRNEEGRTRNEEGRTRNEEGRTRRVNPG
jgi:hypothetical protein